MRLLATFSAAAAVGLALPGAASASLFLLFDRTSARPGQPVTEFTGTSDGRITRDPTAKNRRVDGVVVYLLPIRLAAAIASRSPYPLHGPPPRDRRIVRLGGLTNDGRGVGRLTFVVPNLSPGTYTTGLWCIACRRPGGSFFVSRVDEFPSARAPRAGLLRILPR